MIFAALTLLQAQPSLPPCPAGMTSCKPWERQWDSPKHQLRLGRGPHTLVIADGKAFTRFEYRSGPACQHARDQVLRQLIPSPPSGWTVYAPIPSRVFCVPR